MEGLKNIRNTIITQDRYGYTFGLRPEILDLWTERVFSQMHYFRPGQILWNAVLRELE